MRLVAGGLSTEQDIDGAYADVLFKYFLSEGVACGHSLLVASQDEDPATLTGHLYALTDDDGSVVSSSGDQSTMKIAWRYDALPRVQVFFRQQKFKAPTGYL